MQNQDTLCEDLLDLFEDHRTLQREEEEEEARKTTNEPHEHVCPGPHCPYVRFCEHADSAYVCQLSGACYQSQMRFCYESMTIGDTQPTAGDVCRPNHARRLMVVESAAKASRDAQTILASMHTVSYPEKLVVQVDSKSTNKRNCKKPVVHVERELTEFESTDKKALLTITNGIKLKADQIFRKLLQLKCTDMSTLRHMTKKGDIMGDPALRLRIRNYINRINQERKCLCYNDIHNIMLLNYTQTTRIEMSNEKRSFLLNSPSKAKLREAIIRLIVLLWINYRSTKKRTNVVDSHETFKLFVVGVLYSMQLGFGEQCGVTILPALPDVYNSLPPARWAARRGRVADKGVFCVSVHRSLKLIHRWTATLTKQQATTISRDVSSTIDDIQNCV